MSVQVHGPSVGQNQFNTFYHVSVPGTMPYADAEIAINKHFLDRLGYYGARIEAKYACYNDGRKHYKVAAYKE